MNKTPSMSLHPDAEEMLTWALDWLTNLRANVGQEAFLDAMPNNMLGVPAMRARLETIQAERRMRELVLAQNRQLREEQRARNADGVKRTRVLRAHRSKPGYVGVVEVRRAGRWRRWTCPHRVNASSGPHRTRETAQACADENAWRTPPGA